MTDAPFLSGLRLLQPDVEPDDTADTPADRTGGADGYDAEDFPGWYRDKVREQEDTPDTDPPTAESDENDGALNHHYAFDLAAVQTLERLELANVTVVAGDNGSGKSTLIEAIAVAAGFNPEGGSRNLMFNTYDTHSNLCDHLVLEWRARPRWGWFLRAETFYGMASHIAEDDDPVSGISVMFPDLHNRSHGESFLTLAANRFTGKGLYIFDEPESALSIQGQIGLASLMADSLKKGSQFIVSTHSPLFMAFPGAALYQLDHEAGLERTSFDDLLSTSLWRRFFADPDSFYEGLVF